uniref:Uncharacterized protein n=1 Tax=Oryza brachyantha TaxID=4533 RepID=J3NDF2_ORYBR
MCAYHNSGTVSANAVHAPHDAAPGEATACFHHPPATAAAMAPSPGMKDSSAQRRMVTRRRRPSSNDVNNDVEHHNGQHKCHHGDDVSSAAAGDDDDENGGGKRARESSAVAAAACDDEGPSTVQQLQSELPVNLLFQTLDRGGNGEREKQRPSQRRGERETGNSWGPQEIIISLSRKKRAYVRAKIRMAFGDVAFLTVANS